MKGILKTSAQAVWQAVACAPRQYVLLGDSDHTNHEIDAEVTRQLPLLRAHGVQHLALEKPQKQRGNAIDELQFANLSAYADGSAWKKFVWRMTENASVYAHDRYDVRDSIAGELSLVLAARREGVVLHCINRLGSFEDYLRHEREPELKKFIRFGKHAFRHQAMPPRISLANMQKLDRYMAGYMSYNLGCDAFRAADLQKLAGRSRAAILFGSGHFRRSDNTGIEAALPSASSVFLLIGTTAKVAECITESKAPGGQGLPDFAVETDTGRGLVFPCARKSGLWPA